MAMTKRSSWILVLVAFLIGVAALVFAWTPWGSREVSQAADASLEVPGAVAESPAPVDSAPAAAGPASVPTRDDSATDAQPEAEALKREAVNIGRKLVEVFPKDAVTYALLAAAHHNSGNSGEAVKWLRKCLELDPDRADAYAMWALIESEKGDFEQVAALCKEALKRNPAMRDVQHQLARALMDLGQTDELIRVMEQAIKTPPQSSESYYLLGQGYLQSGEYSKAKQAFQVVVGIRPDHTQAYYGLFKASTRLQQRDEAEVYGKRFRELEAIDRQAATDRNVSEETLSGLPMLREEVAKTCIGAAQIYQVHKDFSQAQELWFRAARLDPNNTLCRTALTALYLRQGRASEAVKRFEQLAKEQPDRGVNHFYMGQLLLELGQRDAAEQAYQKVTELSPEWPAGYRALAEFYLQAGREPVRVKTLATKVVELEPSGPNYYLLAVACAQNRDLEGARAAMGLRRGPGPWQHRISTILRAAQERAVGWYDRQVLSAGACSSSAVCWALGARWVRWRQPSPPAPSNCET